MASITVCDLNPSESFLCELTEDELAYVLGGSFFSKILDFIEAHPVLVSIVIAVLL
ncbi:hypothetical protein [Nostoc sp. MG11]|uniref:hypothetical protein n=1 Tax=Nostoc sp. MG11 TaxID=2721166 RepID=UPI0018664694|nr:hypothetical protein [Nostoc sp. MG11]